MATRQIEDLFDCRTLHITAGSQEFFRLSLFNIDVYGFDRRPLDISQVQEIEWRLAPFSVIAEKGVAVIRKRLSAKEIFVLRDGKDGNTNLIQINVQGCDTQHLQGAFLHQISIIDGEGNNFVPFEGVININRRIQIS